MDVRFACTSLGQNMKNSEVIDLMEFCNTRNGVCTEVAWARLMTWAGVVGSADELARAWSDVETAMIEVVHTSNLVMCYKDLLHSSDDDDDSGSDSNLSDDDITLD
jgi:hypothetical protein